LHSKIKIQNSDKGNRTSLSNPKKSSKKIDTILNKQDAVYPDTNLKLFYKMGT
jgi:hypothetical protein